MDRKVEEIDPSSKGKHGKDLVTIFNPPQEVAGVRGGCLTEPES